MSKMSKPSTSKLASTENKQSASIEVNLEDYTFICPICEKRYRESGLMRARAFPCLHTFCFGCVTNLMSKKMDHDDGVGNINCPTCWEAVKITPNSTADEITRDNLTVKHLLTLISSKKIREPLSYDVREAKSIFGGFGSNEGLFNKPQGVSCFGDNEIIVADTGNHRLQVFSSDGKFKRAIETFIENSADGCDINVHPQDIHYNESKKQIILIDRSHGNLVIFTKEGNLYKVTETNGNTKGLCVDNRGTIYICSSNSNGESTIFKYTSDGDLITSFNSYRLKTPQHMVYQENKIYVVDSECKNVQVYTADGLFIESFGKGKLNDPYGITTDRDGNILVTDGSNIHVFDANKLLAATLQHDELEAKGIAICSDDSVCVCDGDRIIIF